MIKDSLHKSYCEKSGPLRDWYCGKTNDLAIPIYSSYDIRDSGFKVANVDANIFPAGFNNICPTDKDEAIEIFSSVLKQIYGSALDRIMLVTEEHTHNPYYWENVITIKALLESGGKKVLLAIAQPLDAPLEVKSVSGLPIQVVSAYENSPWVKEFKPQLIISNNDFSEAHEEWAKQVTVPINPPRELGWYQRKKSNYFRHYNQIATEFCQLSGLDPFLLTVKTESHEGFDLADEAAMKALADKVDAMVDYLKVEYAQRKIDETPTIFIKNNAGTYGLGVSQVLSGKDVMEWNYKARKKMKASKGGRGIEDVIIQEGISSRVQAEGATAEPVIYMIGSELAGGFLRSHAEKSKTESLNSPGAVYKRLCVADLNVSLEGSKLENVYGWSARLGLLAIGLEAREMNVKFKALTT